jgi:hypothetical protein
MYKKKIVTITYEYKVKLGRYNVFFDSEKDMNSKDEIVDFLADSISMIRKTNNGVIFFTSEDNEKHNYFFELPIKEWIFEESELEPWEDERFKEYCKKHINKYLKLLKEED